MLRVLGINIPGGLLLMASVFTLPIYGRSVTINQPETFSSGSPAGWRSGENAGQQPIVVTTGGPDGASDRFLSLQTSGTHNTQSRMVTFNTESNWAGDYASLGVTALEMDLKNFGDTFGSPVTLQIRIALKETTGSTSPGYATKLAIVLPDDGKWHHAVFSFRPEDFAAIGSPTMSLMQLLADPGEIRILHSVEPSLKGDLVEGLVQLGIDNIAAVPESGSCIIALSGGVALVLRRRRVAR
jgi:hypothetical protein